MRFSNKHKRYLSEPVGNPRHEMRNIILFIHSKFEIRSSFISRMKDSKSHTGIKKIYDMVLRPFLRNLWEMILSSAFHHTWVCIQYSMLNFFYPIFYQYSNTTQRMPKKHSCICSWSPCHENHFWPIIMPHKDANNSLLSGFRRNTTPSWRKFISSSQIGSQASSFS